MDMETYSEVSNGNKSIAIDLTAEHRGTHLVNVYIGGHNNELWKQAEFMLDCLNNPVVYVKYTE